MDEAKLEFILKKIGEQDRLWSQISNLIDLKIKNREQEINELKKVKEILAKLYGNDSDEEKKIADHAKNLQKAVSDQKDDTDINTTKEKCKVNTDAYEQGIPEFMERYEKDDISRVKHETLSVSNEYGEKLIYLEYDGWEMYPDKDKITLVISNMGAAYWAYGDKELGNYYFLIPTKQTKFNKSTVVQGAFLTFYDMPLEELSEDSKKPYVLRPAVAIRKGDTFSVYEKGQITFSKN